jgi:hypothetical protein
LGAGGLNQQQGQQHLQTCHRLHLIKGNMKEEGVLLQQQREAAEVGPGYFNLPP